VLKKLLFSLLLFLPIYAMGQTISRYNMRWFDQQIRHLYAAVPNSKSDDVAQRIAADSEFFLGKSYLLGALGEGPDAEFDKSPIYRTDKFDCMTFVSTVLALVESNNLSQFQTNIKKVRYQDSEVTYFTRNHFTSVDWNKTNIFNGYILDITERIVDTRGYPIEKDANTVINKPGWYRSRTTNSIKYFTRLSATKTRTLLNKLHRYAYKTRREKVVMYYLPIKKFFYGNGKAIKFMFKQIPSGSIIEIIRPNWNLISKIGTRLMVSHLGFAIRTEHGLMFRHASTTSHRIVDVPLEDYLRDNLNNPTIKGFNLQKIVIPEVNIWQRKWVELFDYMCYIFLMYL
jgi:hypothetical protein